MANPDHELRIGNETLPLRLIDVPSTIASGGGVIFIVPSDWNFHVISHTWSQSIRDLSKTVGKSIGFCPGHPQQYSDAFRGSRFNGDPGYGHLIKFLQVLMGDGVSEVWFDALCINQDENAKEEKEREILHMGAYYKHSAGCYVVHHGLGEGFDLLGQNRQTGMPCLPRWFSRVWTLQEFLLPSKLTFAVSNLSQLDSTGESCMICSFQEKFLAGVPGIGELDIAAFANIIRETEGIDELFKEFVAGHSIEEIKTLQEFINGSSRKDYKKMLSMLEGLTGQSTERGEGVLENTTYRYPPLAVVGKVMKVMLCTSCHMPTLVRKANDQQLHFVDRQAYLLLVWLQHCPPKFTTSVGHFLVSYQGWQLPLDKLFNLLGKCYICASYQLLDMIQDRFCSQDEDRVLSILSLLGLEGRMQALRTGQTLADQVVKVAQALAIVNPSLLVHLCIKDVVSAPHMGLSWIPNLRTDSSDLSKTLGIRPGCRWDEDLEPSLVLDHIMSTCHGSRWSWSQQERVQLQEVTTKGALRLEGNVVGARLVVGPRGSMEQHFNEANCYTCINADALHAPGARLLVHQMQECHLEVSQNLSIPLHANAFVLASIVEGFPAFQPFKCIIRLDPRWTQPPDRDLCPDCDGIYKGGLYLPIPCLHFLLPVDLILLLWAEVEGGESLVMVCMGTTDLQLHKIGVLSLAPEVSKAIFSSTKASSEFLLGGFGTDDVQEFWTNWGMIHRPVPCNCLPTIAMKARRARLWNLATTVKSILGPTYKKFYVSQPEDIGPIEGLSIMSSTCHPQSWFRRDHSIMLKRQKFEGFRVEYFESAASSNLVPVPETGVNDWITSEVTGSSHFYMEVNCLIADTRYCSVSTSFRCPPLVGALFLMDEGYVSTPFPLPLNVIYMARHKRNWNPITFSPESKKLHFKDKRRSRDRVAVQLHWNDDKASLQRQSTCKQKGCY